LDSFGDDNLDDSFGCFDDDENGDDCSGDGV
jgi:hypothetical protein